MKWAIVLLLLPGCMGFETADITVEGTAFTYAQPGTLEVVEARGTDWQDLRFASEPPLRATIGGTVHEVGTTWTTLGEGAVHAGDTIRLCARDLSKEVLLRISTLDSEVELTVKMEWCP